VAKKRKIKPAVFEKQLFIFSNEVEPMIDTWFKGSVIIEYDLDNDDLSKIPELSQLVFINQFFDIKYKKSTCVINYTKKGLLFTKIKSDCVVCHVGNRTEHKKLEKLAASIATYEKHVEAYDRLLSLTKSLDFQVPKISTLPTPIDSELNTLARFEVQLSRTKKHLFKVYREIFGVAH
jgi:hypothetical protein